MTARALPKAGNTASEYEDAFRPASQEALSAGRTLRFAIADGASEGMLSGVWANLLVETFCDPAEHPRLENVLPAAIKRWEVWQRDYLAYRQQHKPIQWFEEPGLERGAFASLLGLILHPGGKWWACALGDSCLFQVREGALVAAFPLTKAADFNSRPTLLGSNPRYNVHSLPGRVIKKGAWRADDCFYLMTDALAEWFLRQLEGDQHPWDTLRAHIREEAAFETWVGGLREDKTLKNDDVTVLEIQVRGVSEAENPTP